MCGICGIISQAPIENLTPIQRMQSSLHHRGPDGDGDFYHQHIVLAMRRLSIIDLTGGWQPLFNEDRSLVLVANGEIYNYIELRHVLQTQGHHFGTASDCETILHLYEEYGLDCVNHLRGMFAFALWDTQLQRLVLARDRMGEKPLYLYEQPDQLIFASELKALLQSKLVPFELSPGAIDFYFHYSYVPEPATPLKGVRKLKAGTILIVDVEPWQVREIFYWRMEDAVPLEGNPAELIRAELEAISELVIRADVPVGVALSGGLDSSAIMALVAKKYPNTLHAFSVGYPDHPPYDERYEAASLAKYLGVPFHDVELTTTDLVAFFPELVYWRDDPIADISGYGYYAVMRLAREWGVPVVLQGQAGDELFWGYPWLRQANRESLQKEALYRRDWRAFFSHLSLPIPSHLNVEETKYWLKQMVHNRFGWEYFDRFFLCPPTQMVFYDIVPDFRTARVQSQSLYTSEFIEQLNGCSPTSLFTFPHPWPQVDIRMTRLICETYLQENGITQGDRLSMASSIELRLPLVDYRLIETVIGLRKTQSDYHLPPKAWFRAAIQDLLPDWVLNRPKKGFTPPVREWHKALFAAYGDQLDSGYLVQAGILSPASSRQLARGPFPANAVVPLSFKALVLEFWCRQMDWGRENVRCRR